MSLWDTISNLAKELTKTPENAPKPAPDAGQRIPSAAYLPDTAPKTSVSTPGVTRSSGFGLYSDIAKNLPANPGGWNDAIEQLRVGGIETVGGTLGVITEATLGRVDEKTDGALTRLLMAGPKNVRSNYAFVRDVENNSTGMGLLAGLGIIGGGALAGAAAVTVGAPVAAVAGLTAIGAALTGKIARSVAKTGIAGEESATSAQFAESEAGQVRYNFGRDIYSGTVGKASRALGYEDWGDTTKGLGAVVSGFLNFGLELGVGPDIAAGKVTGALLREATVAPIVRPTPGLTGKILAKREEELTAARLADDVDTIKRTVNGEVTKYTPLFDFLQNNSPSTILQRKQFDNEIGMVGANLLAGASRESIGLVLRTGRGDISALQELAAKRADVFAEMQRYTDSLQAVKTEGIVSLTYKGDNIVLSNRFKNNVEMVTAEVKELRNQVKWLDDALKVDSRMQNRTTSRWAWVERTANDLAKEKAARKTETTDLTARQSLVGKTVQTIYQKGPFSAFVRMVDRLGDDIPKNTINFNDPIQSPDRLRTSIRSAVKYKGLLPEEGLKLYNDMIKAPNEIVKKNIVDTYTTRLAENLGAKYNVHPSIISEVLKAYDKANRTLLEEARSARDLKQGYMFGPGGVDDILSDPQLVTQLANGAFLPDPKMWDAAFKRYSKKKGAEAGLPLNTKLLGQFVAEEFNSLWRGLTLFRAGYPINVIRDSSVRVYGDAALFSVLKELGKQEIEALTKSSNTVGKISTYFSAIGNPKKKLENIRRDINLHNATIKAYEKALNRAGYDVKKPPKKIPAEISDILDNLNNIKGSRNELVRQENAVISGVKTPTVGRDKSIRVLGYDFPAPFSGRFGDITRQQLLQKDDLRRALSNVRELEIENIRRGSTGTRTILATQEEGLHLVEWAKTLQDILGFDDVARMIMSGKSKREVISHLRSPQGFSYMDRMGYTSSDAGLMYEKAKAVVNAFAPSKELHNMILENRVSVDALRKLYPDVNERPPLLTDLAADNLGVSNRYIDFRDAVREGVAWLSTAPTSRLMYSPYFAVKYQEKLQSMVHIANIQGRHLTIKDRENFESAARAYGIKEYKEKLNSFHRDMNYGGFVNYLLAFFPAVVEQFRAYGRISLEHPEFLIKAAQITTLPDRVLNAQEDAFGNKYVEVDLPVLGVKGRIGADWFNVFNPTGGSSIVSAGPIMAFSVNEYTRRTGTENAFTNWVLPFGSQSNSFKALQPNTIKRGYEAFILSFRRNGEQFNKDSNMFLQQWHSDYVRENGKNPSGTDLAEGLKESQDKAFFMAFLRFGGAVLSPAQPQYVTGLGVYRDELNRLREKYGNEEGEDKFVQTYPEAFMLAARLSDSTSGLIPDQTSAYLAKKNKDVILDIVATVGKDNLNVLGAVFNDADYAFSSAANAWLSSTTVPGTDKKFRDFKDVLDVTRSAIVSKGWRDYTKMVETVRDELENGPQRLNPNRGYGKVLLKQYKDKFVQTQKELNPLWYSEWEGQSGASGSSRRNATIDALTIAANTPKLWADLEKQPRWTNIVNYLNFRYDVYDALKAMNATIDSPRAIRIKEQVDDYVEALRSQDVDFGRFYDRYLSRDTFDHVYGE